MQAALYMVGIAVNHPFLDGNKRTGYLSGIVFLIRNQAIGEDLELNDPEMGQWLEDVVARRMTFDAFVDHLRVRLTS